MKQEPTTNMERNVSIRSLLAALIPFAVFEIHTLRFNNWLIDDAGISFAYARNFIHGHGVVSQVGAPPVEGFSNPLWTLIISPLFIADPADPTALIKLLSVCLILATYLTVLAINRRIFNTTGWANLVTLGALLLVSVNTSFVVWTTSGLENPLYALLTAVYGVILVRYYTQGTSPAPTKAERPNALAAGAGLVTAGLALTRPDGLLFLAVFPALLFMRMAMDFSRWRDSIRHAAIFLATALLPFMGYLLFRVLYFGDVYPNTYHAKGGPTMNDLVGLLLLSNDCINKLYDLFHGMFASCTGSILFLLVLGLGGILAHRRRGFATIALIPLLACSLAIYLLLPADWMGEYRFATPFLLLLPVTFFAFLGEALSFSSLRLKVQRPLFGLIAIIVIGCSGRLYQERSATFAEAPAAPFYSVAQSYGLRFNYYSDALGITNASLLAPDLGGTLYFSRLRVYDLVGLCDRKIAPLMAANDTAGLADHVFALRPTFIHVHDFWSVRSGFFDDPRFRELYEPISESESTWAINRGRPGVYSGDYVLRSAVPSPEILEHLRRDLEANAQLGFSPDLKNAHPFPRS